MGIQIYIYSVPYPNITVKKGQPARIYHGIEHVTRAAAYIPVLVNLYQRHDPTTFSLLGKTDEDREINLKLLQLAVLFHDAAREGEDADLWDNDSALFLYYYFNRNLRFTTSKSKNFR
ncbi:hypothetical protein [Legionella israelensis]|uniref:hypothetical protein n=1 Tax=Legionella israelensis TaxID=454 RepID=UPI0013EFC028|nr:hypothetical protein [Legionella israelensis]